MISLVAWLPGFFSAFIALFRSPERAFLNVYLPVLILLPHIFNAEIQGLPDFTFGQAAILPIFLIAAVTRIWRWRLSILDLLVVAYVAACVYSEGYTTGFPLGRKLFVEMCGNVLFPYLLAKVLIHRGGYTVAFAKRFVFLIFVDILLSSYEMRFVSNPYIGWFRYFFPGQGYDWPALFRYGFVRIGGPFAQPILFGTIIGVAILLHYWLVKQKVWEIRFRLLPPLPLSKSMIITIGLLFGLLMTLSRGPVLSTLVGGIIIGIGFSPTRIHSFIIRLLVVSAVGFMAYQTYLYYVEINKYLAESELIGNIAYRGEMNREYAELAFKKAWWGWGNTGWPRLSGIKSVDNQYLWLLVKHGVVGLGTLLLTIGAIMLRLFYRGIMVPKKFRFESALAFTFLALLVAMATSFITVYMGMQTEPIFFMIIGWAEGFVISPYGALLKDKTLTALREKQEAAAPSHPFA